MRPHLGLSVSLGSEQRQALAPRGQQLGQQAIGCRVYKSVLLFREPGTSGFLVKTGDPG